MTKKVFVLMISTMTIAKSSDAQIIDIAAIIKAAVSKVIRATDLEVQRLQTQTIELQDAQEALQNLMTKSELDQISAWVQKQMDLYQEYYNELWQVKQVIADYDKVKNIITLQAKIISLYNSAYSLFKQDRNFSASEIEWMGNVYSGILSESLKNVEQVLLVVDAFVTQMSDEERLKIIDNAAAGIQKNYNDLKQFNAQNIQLSLQRAAERNDVGTVKQLYGLE
jgi:hypothetical protein